jgi:hypothetical protein
MPGVAGTETAFEAPVRTTRHTVPHKPKARVALSSRDTIGGTHRTAAPLHGALFAERRDAERRDGERHDTNIAGRLSSKRRSSAIRVLNISRSGLRCTCRSNVAAGDRIVLQLPGLPKLRADVRWRSDDLIGCQFTRRLTASEVDVATQSGVVIGNAFDLFGPPPPAAPPEPPTATQTIARRIVMFQFVAGACGLLWLGVAIAR